MDPYYVNVSSVQDFMQCRYRWVIKWCMNRVPRFESAALAEGKLLHLIFEDYFKGKRTMAESVEWHCRKWPETATTSGEMITAQKAVEGIKDRKEALCLWISDHVFDETLEVESPFEVEHPLDSSIILRGRPDYVGVMEGAIWHRQNRGLAANMNFGVYMELATRHYHEHVYAEALSKKYAWKDLPYGGTFFNLVRKLKFRTNYGKKNERVKTVTEMFFQYPMAIDLESALHQHVMCSLLAHINEMRRVQKEFFTDGTMPPANEKMNGGYNGSTIDPFFRILTGKVDPMDNNLFKDREELYAPIEENEE
jgi:hypothetical protein